MVGRFHASPSRSRSAPKSAWLTSGPSGPNSAVAYRACRPRRAGVAGRQGGLRAPGRDRRPGPRSRFRSADRGARAGARCARGRAAAADQRPRRPRGPAVTGDSRAPPRERERRRQHGGKAALRKENQVVGEAVHQLIEHRCRRSMPFSMPTLDAEPCFLVGEAKARPSETGIWGLNGDAPGSRSR